MVIPQFPAPNRRPLGPSSADVVELNYLIGDSGSPKNMFICSDQRKTTRRSPSANFQSQANIHGYYRRIALNAVDRPAVICSFSLLLWSRPVDPSTIERGASPSPSFAFFFSPRPQFLLFSHWALRSLVFVSLCDFSSSAFLRYFSLFSILQHELTKFTVSSRIATFGFESYFRCPFSPDGL